jgi:Uma2 family endonuclease
MMMAVDKQLLTLDEYHRIIDLPENRDRIFELIDGELIEKMPSFTPSRIALRIGSRFTLYLDKHDLGYVSGADGGYVMPDGNVLIPDVAFISKVRMPEIPDREALVSPDLAVEVMSPTDRKRALRRKAERYLELGTRMVWLIFPDEQIVEVYVIDEDVITVGIDGILDGGDVLPGFLLPVRDIFTAGR